MFIVESIKYVKRVDDDDFYLNNERERMFYDTFPQDKSQYVIGVHGIRIGILPP